MRIVAYRENSTTRTHERIAMSTVLTLQTETAAPYMTPRDMQLEATLRPLVAQLLAITGDPGVEVLHNMGDEAANDYLTGCLALAHDALEMVRGRE